MAPKRKVELQTALDTESKKFQACFHWMEKNLPEAFFDQVDTETVILVVHSLMDFVEQDCFVQVHVKKVKVVLSIEVDERVFGEEVFCAEVFQAKESFDGKALKVVVMQLQPKEVALPVLEEDECQITTEKEETVLACRRLYEPGFMKLVAKTARRMGAKWQKIEVGLAKEGFVGRVVGEKVLAEAVLLASLFPGQEELERSFQRLGCLKSVS